MNESYAMRGVPSAITDANGNRIRHQINAQNGRPTSAFQTGLISVDYTHAQGNLTQIRRGGFLQNSTSRIEQDYNFAYDAFGAMTDIHVGTRRLMSYTYNADRTLHRRTYGNNHNVTYRYDLLGRVSAVEHRNTSTGAVQAVVSHT